MSMERCINFDCKHHHSFIHLKLNIGQCLNWLTLNILALLLASLYEQNSSDEANIADPRLAVLPVK